MRFLLASIRVSVIPALTLMLAACPAGGGGGGY
jgi:hypothetical protein